MVEKHTLSKIVQNAMGDSVTPSRLKESKSPGLFDRLLGNAKIPGPFHSNLQSDESLHYLFRDSTDVTMPEEEDQHSDEHTVIWGESLVPAVVVVTDHRTIFFYSTKNERKQISLKHVDLVNIEFNDGILLNTMNLTTTQRSVETTISLTSSFSSELSDAVAYIADQAGIEEETTGSTFEDGDVDSARSALMDQLSNIDGIRDQIDISKVADRAATGATIGIKRGQVTGVLGLVVFGGIEIYNQLNQDGDGDFSVDDLDPEETAEDIAKWQKVGKSSEYKGMELASGAIGAAISVDKQTSGREVSRVLSNLDVDWVSKQLEDGNQKNTAIQVASEAVEAYSAEISWLSNQQRSHNDTSS